MTPIHLLERKPEASKQSNKNPNQNHVFIVRTLAISQPIARVLLLLLTAKRSCPLNSYALTVRRFGMMMQSSTKMIEVHKIKIDSLEENFHFDTEVTKVDRDKLFSLTNPRYKEIIEKFTYLNGMMQDVDYPVLVNLETLVQSSPILVGPLTHLEVQHVLNANVNRGL
jgi:hypothetical protein